MTFYDLYLHFQHQNRVRRPQKWLETCVTLIYYDVIYLPYDIFNKMAAILDFSPHSIFHRGENRGKLIFMKGRYQSVMCEKISFLHFFSKSQWFTVYCSWAIRKIQQFRESGHHHGFKNHRLTTVNISSFFFFL